MNRTVTRGKLMLCLAVAALGGIPLAIQGAILSRPGSSFAWTFVLPAALPAVYASYVKRKPGAHSTTIAVAVLVVAALASAGLGIKLGVEGWIALIGAVGALVTLLLT